MKVTDALGSSLRRVDHPLLWAVAGSIARLAAAVSGRAPLRALHAESLERRGRPAAAAAAYLAAAAGGGRPDWAVKAASLHATAGDLEAAVAAHERAVALAPDRATSHQQLARAREQAGDVAGAIDAYQAAIARDDTYPAWHLRLARLLAKRREWPRAVEILTALTERDPGNAEARHALGRAQANLGDWPAAVAAYAAAVALEPRGSWFHDLGSAQERDLRPGVRRDNLLGLVRGDQPDWAAVARSFAAAAEAEPDVAAHHARLGTALVQAGDLAGAVDALATAHRLAPDEAAWAYRLGVAILQQGARRALEPEERARAEAAFARTLEADPDHAAARKRLVDARLTVADWAGAADLAWPSDTRGATTSPALHALRGFVEQGPTTGAAATVAGALDELDADELEQAPLDWWRTLHCRLIGLGWFTLAYEAKRAAARRTVSSTTADRPDRAIELARALAYLDHHDDAATVVAAATEATDHPRWQRALEKVGADLAFLRGGTDDAARALRYADALLDDPAERRFRELVAGRRVAVVGPAVPRAELGARIDDFDVVVRTRHLTPASREHASRIGSRTDVAYYASTSSGLFGDDIRRALGEDELGLAVFRTSTFDPALTHLVRPGDLRFVPSEFKAGFLGGPMAILRIVYDLLRYAPAEVEVSNIDFFLSPDEYGEGHDVERRTEQQWRDLGLLAARALPHDYLSDFTVTRSLHRAGQLAADPAVSELLAMTPDEYLAAMDRARAVT